MTFDFSHDELMIVVAAMIDYTSALNIAVQNDCRDISAAKRYKLCLSVWDKIQGVPDDAA